MNKKKIFILGYFTFNLFLNGCGSKEMGSFAGLSLIVTIVVLSLICYLIYFIFKINQFVIQAINLYKEAIIKEEKIIGLLIDIRDGTKSTNSLSKSELVDHGIICVCSKCLNENRFSKEVVNGQYFICKSCNFKNFINKNDLGQNKVYGQQINLEKEKDYNCIKCDSLITLEGKEIENGFFICPVCKADNKLK